MQTYILAVYILLRLFIRKPYYLEGDEIRHLATAKNFYKLWNKSFYDMHPPFYSWLVRYLKSGVFVSFLCSIGLFIESAKLYGKLGLTPLQQSVALAFLAFNYTLIYYSNRTFRYQLIAMLGTSMIFYLLWGRWVVAGLFWGLLGLTCTFAGLRGFFIWGLLGANPWTLFFFVYFYGSWIYEKFKVYSSNKYYPSGTEGMLERVNPFTIKQLFSPLYFPWVYSYYGKKELGYDFKNWLKKVGGVFGLYPPLTPLVPLALFFAVKGAFKSPLWISVLALALLYPSTYKRFLPRNSIMVIPILGFLLAKGLPPIPEKWLFLGISGGLVGFLAFNRTWVLTKPKIRARITSKELNFLPKDGVLAEGFICQPIAYQTDKRVVVMTLEPEWNEAVFQTNLAIKKFDLNYVVVSNRWKGNIKQDYPALEYVETFKLICTVYEDGDFYRIYEIQR